MPYYIKSLICFLKVDLNLWWGEMDRGDYQDTCFSQNLSQQILSLAREEMKPSLNNFKELEIK